MLKRPCFSNLMREIKPLQYSIFWHSEIRTSMFWKYCHCQCTIDTFLPNPLAVWQAACLNRFEWSFDTVIHPLFHPHNESRNFPCRPLNDETFLAPKTTLLPQAKPAMHSRCRVTEEGNDNEKVEPQFKCKLSSLSPPTQWFKCHDRKFKFPRMHFIILGYKNNVKCCAKLLLLAAAAVGFPIRLAVTMYRWLVGLSMKK